ncbi:MAG: iron ABC transporter substrate-binding protein [Desulfococcaceae bacterium]|jgi:iron complex transport system substrate-binding protein|nr:iron ABC transporter substrate-binding protein [Desulfococcaceae bacterium]
MKKKYTAIVTFCLLCLSPVLSLSAGESIRIRDMAGRDITVPCNPEKIACIGPGALRLIVYLQAEDKVAGVEDMEKRNPRGRPYWMAARHKLENLPRIGPGGPAGINKKPDMEAILTVSPRVIFITYMDAALADEVQQTLGIPVAVLSYGAFATFDEAVYQALKIAGKVLHKEKRAHDVTEYIESLRADLKIRTGNIPADKKPGVYVGGIGHRGAHGIESTEVSYIPLQWTHSRNLAEQIKSRIGSHVFADKESLLRLNPDVIFIDGGGLALVTADFRKKPEYYQALRAFQNRRIYTLLPFNSYTTNIGTALADAYAIGKILYPEKFADLNPEAKADEIYTFLLGKPVYGELKKEYGSIGQTAPFLE